MPGRILFIRSARGLIRGIRLTLAITWPQGVLGDEDSHAVAAEVHGGVREWQGLQLQEAVTPSQ